MNQTKWNQLMHRFGLRGEALTTSRPLLGLDQKPRSRKLTKPEAAPSPDAGALQRPLMEPRG